MVEPFGISYLGTVKRTFHTLLSLSTAAGIANAEMRSIDEFLDHPQLRARQRWREVPSPAGLLPALLPPATISDVEPVFNPIPALGEHTESILTELEYEATDIAQLRADGVV